MRNILVKKNSYGKKKKEKIVIRSDKILLNELYEKVRGGKVLFKENIRIVFIELKF